MIEFSKDHSSAWMEMMSAYQIFRAKLFDWAHEPDQKKQKDLLLELDSWENQGYSQKNAGSRSSAQHRDVGRKSPSLSSERTDSDCPTGTR